MMIMMATDRNIKRLLDYSSLVWHIAFTNMTLQCRHSYGPTKAPYPTLTRKCHIAPFHGVIVSRHAAPAGALNAPL